MGYRQTNLPTVLRDEARLSIALIQRVLATVYRVKLSAVSTVEPVETWPSAAAAGRCFGVADPGQPGSACGRVGVAGSGPEWLLAALSQQTEHRMVNLSIARDTGPLAPLVGLTRISGDAPPGLSHHERAGGGIPR